MLCSLGRRDAQDELVSVAQTARLAFISTFISMIKLRLSKRAPNDPQHSEREMPHNDDPLARFLNAQAIHYEQALSELRQGRKDTHWSWFILPQLKALARSPRSAHYGIADLDEARLYAEHPTLGPRLEACFQAILTHPHQEIEVILGEGDARKLRSCATLFSHSALKNQALRDSALELISVFYAGQPCARSQELLASA